MLDDFEEQRPRLVAIAYGMLGDRTEAEDIVQEAWLRWESADTASVREPAAYLTTVVTRLSVDHLRSARSRRESYVGPWLPEPIVTAWDEDPADVVAEAEQISFALLTALERLNPVERAVFLLRDVFDLDYSDIASVVDRAVPNCRQIAKRARERVGDHARPSRASREADAAVLAAFSAAAMTGDVEGLAKVLAADVVAWSDGGADRHAARRPIVGFDRVATYVVNMTRRGLKEGWDVRMARVNGSAGLVTFVDGAINSVGVLEVGDGNVIGIRTVLNPDKLRDPGGPAA